MADYDLSQLASTVPGFINGLSRRRKPQDPASLELDFYFDFSLFYGETRGADPDARSRSDASSTPELTSGSSEEDGAPSPGPNVDTFRLKAAVKQAKQQDDHFTVPQRELRPKDAQYPSKIHLDNAAGPSFSTMPDVHVPAGNGYISSSPSGRAPLGFDTSTARDSMSSRGKRCSPLQNPEKVAGCNEGGPCSSCVNDAAKLCANDCPDLAKTMCFRHLLPSGGSVFQAICKAGMPRPQYASSSATRGHSSTWHVSFEPVAPTFQPLHISVKYAEGQSTQECVLDACALQESRMIQWASSQMCKEGNIDFQSALDILLVYCAGKGRLFLPHFEVTKKVHELRCMYKIWRQRKFFVCQPYPGCEMQELSNSVHQALRNIVKSRMKSLEVDVLEHLGKLPGKLKPAERLPVWACFMQLILLYRDVSSMLELRESYHLQEVQHVANDLFSHLVVMCAHHFGKHKPEPVSEDGGAIKNQLNGQFKVVEIRRGEFCDYTREYPNTLDRLFNTFLAEPQKRSKRSGGPAAKRARVSV
ncbi:Uu.00g015340.m01.CDS01 [Anthostomella pinea]|uniref:Uu.00g015340.m01.CDS01 n=1 Tax=Anthostomella pinea TaxID=933095 RepID=A0AAI8YQG0_9PEZI|nr:Uu.00g015340.m01.CDS01 [Anthostomella pinea]